MWIYITAKDSESAILVWFCLFENGNAMDGFMPAHRTCDARKSANHYSLSPMHNITTDPAMQTLMIWLEGKIKERTPSQCKSGDNAKRPTIYIPGTLRLDQECQKPTNSDTGTKAMSTELDGCASVHGNTGSLTGPRCTIICTTYSRGCGDDRSWD